MKIIKVVAAIIKEDNKILTTQRGHGDYAGLWEFPGGKVEDGEDNFDALKREILEELGVKIDVEEHVYTVEYDYPTFHLSMDCYFAHIISGSMELHVHQSAKWITKEQLDEVEWLEADIQIIDKLKEIL